MDRYWLEAHLVGGPSHSRCQTLRGGVTLQGKRDRCYRPYSRQVEKTRGDGSVFAIQSRGGTSALYTAPGWIETRLKAPHHDPNGIKRRLDTPNYFFETSLSVRTR